MGKVKKCIYLLGTYQIAKQFYLFGKSVHDQSDEKDSIFEKW
jgi:hypothetical protein